ncbi:response regulator transcription factor [Acidovorax sp. Leaf78]|uniref:response regulator transcription factor n=1 Tax=unclassified Acidovorax TaxID=2684926 RepID=UPI0006F62DCE|nr:response regulator transcription factor [Acidovorax sp. Leaf78]KQO27554.1 two-component system response regulator [Acidovorax sp. Leaf78]RYF77376.1 MAG: response regulator transcription factor [Comamonadaceae bacterium]
MRIAALDDDALQLDLIKQATEAMGHVCHTHLNGADFLRELRRETFDLLIVDWHLPDTTGPEVVRWVRKNVGTQLPILFVTHRQEERDIVEGLGSGADDFMVKPVRIGELTARVWALLRRAYPDNAGGVLEFGRYRFLPETRSIEVDGVAVELKNREYDLALFLFQNMGRLLSRDHLKDIIWGQVADVMSRSLDTHISRLRTLLDLRPANGFIVSAVYGVGYRFEAVDAQKRA